MWFKHDSVEQTDSGIHIDNVREEVPKLRRIYSVRINERATIKIEMRTYSSTFGRMKTGELTQPNGRWLLFDPDAIADKIIDPVLAPLIQQRVDEIYAIDKAFMDSDPAEFIDERGVFWERKK